MEDPKMDRREAFIVLSVWSICLSDCLEPNFFLYCLLCFIFVTDSCHIAQASFGFVSLLLQPLSVRIAGIFTMPSCLAVSVSLLLTFTLEGTSVGPRRCPNRSASLVLCPFLLASLASALATDLPGQAVACPGLFCSFLGTWLWLSRLK